MIYKLQKKFILVSAIAVAIVIVVMFLLINVLNINSMNHNLDALSERIALGDGRFPLEPNHGPKDERPIPGDKDDFGNKNNGFINPESPFSTRYFAVWFDQSNQIIRTNTESIYSITTDEAKEYAQKVNNKTKGWMDSYRYNVYETFEGRTIIFIDASLSLSSFYQTLLISGAVLLSCGLIIILLIIIFSKRVVKPVAESYEKQKGFITDAGHELKTPLTLILTNLDIAEAEVGKNEWLDDIRSEGHRMTSLVNQLVELTRMDEDASEEIKTEVNLSDIVLDVASEFGNIIDNQHKQLELAIENNLKYIGNEEHLRKLISILMDNAVKYCDDQGSIVVTVKNRRNLIITIENTYQDVENIELDRLFDRFYRADKARTYQGGYGIGLSIAYNIVQKHNGEITAYAKNKSIIGFKIVLK